ncbi:MAG: ATP-binding protein [Planctomycetota bacterium]
MEMVDSSLTIPGTVLEAKDSPSDLALVTPLVMRLVDRLVEEGCVAAKSRRKVELCFDEGLTNAVVHGNGCDFQKKISVLVFRDDESWGVVIKDEGEGFSLDDLPRLPPEEEVWQETGRGIRLMELYMDEITYYDGGSTLMLRQQIK